MEHATRQAARRRRSSRPVVASLYYLVHLGQIRGASRGAVAMIVVEEAKLNGEVQALREVDRGEREAICASEARAIGSKVANDSWVESG
jgi:hypothetical protein